MIHDKWYMYIYMYMIHDKWYRTRCNLTLQSYSKHVLLRKNAKSLTAMAPLWFWSLLHTTIMRTKLNELYGRWGLWYLSTAVSEEEWHLWTHPSTQNKVCLTCGVSYTNTGPKCSLVLARRYNIWEQLRFSTPIPPHDGLNCLGWYRWGTSVCG